MEHRTLAALIVAGSLLFGACADDTVSPEPRETPSELAASSSHSQVAPANRDLTPLGTSLKEINEKLSERGANIAVARAEYVLAANTSGPLIQEANHTIFADDRQLRLDTRWVPGDARRSADGNNITFLNYTPFMPANFGTDSQLDGEGAIDASFATWDEVQCSGLDLVKRVDTGVFPSAVLTSGGVPGDPFVADVVTLGFLPGLFFDLVLGPGASQNVLGVTFTSVFGTNTPGGFVPSDIDNDGRNDTAFKEVWYNDAFEWTTDASGSGTDIETVALHENGHALELGHFGKIHATFNNGKGNNRAGRLHVSPRAVMNAVILSTLRQPLGSDNASYCGNFGSWPQ